MAGRVPRMQTPNARQLVGTRGGIRLEQNNASLIASLTKVVAAATTPSTVLPSVGVFVVTYVATGAEGPNFMVPIGSTLPSASYAVAWAPSGIQNVPLLDLPNGVGDRTTTSFRVLIGGLPLAVGETFVFIVFETTNTSARIVSYIATGAEGTDFIVPIGALLADDDYALVCSPTGLTTIPLLDLPTGPANRTTSGFRVLVVGGAITPGDTFTFFLFEV